MNKNWPDPSVWVSDLLHQLRELDAWFVTYEAIRSKRLILTQEDLDQRGIIEPVEPEVTHQYARAVSRVVEALEQLPPFSDGAGLIALKTLRMDIDALDDGSKPARLQPRSGTSNGSGNKGRRKAKANIVSYVLLLEEAGLENAAARDRVVRIFAEQGVKLSASTLFRWTEQIRGASPGDPDAPGLRIVTKNLDGWTSDPGWPFSPEEAEQIIKAVAAGTSISLAHTT
jgi:hypothetical protein